MANYETNSLYVGQLQATQFHNFLPNPNMAPAIHSIPNIPNLPFPIISTEHHVMKVQQPPPPPPPCPMVPHQAVTHLTLPLEYLDILTNVNFANFRTDNVVTTCAHCNNTNYVLQKTMEELKPKLEKVDDFFAYLKTAVFQLNHTQMITSNLSANAHEFHPSQNKNRAQQNSTSKDLPALCPSGNSEVSDLHISNETVPDVGDCSILESGLDSGVDSANTDSAITDAVDAYAQNDDNDISGEPTDNQKNDAKMSTKKRRKAKKSIGSKQKSEEESQEINSTRNNKVNEAIEHRNYKTVDESQNFHEMVNQKQHHLQQQQQQHQQPQQIPQAERNIRTPPQQQLLQQSLPISPPPVNWKHTNRNSEPIINHASPPNSCRMSTNGGEVRRQNGPYVNGPPGGASMCRPLQSRKGTLSRSRDSSAADRRNPGGKYNSSYAGPNDYSGENHGSSYNLQKFNRKSRYSKQEIETVVHETEGNLFNASEEYALAHCVAEDFRMGSGIAVAFKLNYGGVAELLEQGKTIGEVAVLQHNHRYIFYLVTKSLSHDKPTKENMRRAIESLRKECERVNVKKLSMPLIGCGLDKLRWDDVSEMLYEVFKDTDIEILVYKFKEEENTSEATIKKLKQPKVELRPHPLVEIEAETVFIVYGTVNGFMDNTCNSLNAKYSFKNEYKENCGKHKTGDVIEIVRKSEHIYVFLIRNTESEEFSFQNLEACIVQFGYIAKKKKDFRYIGIESVGNEGDLFLLDEKIITVFRNKLHYNLELYVCGAKMQSGRYPPSKSSANGSNY